MRIRDEIEALGWMVIAGPTQTSGGWKATIQRDTVSVLATGSTAIGVLEDLLRSAEERARRKP
jgi:hypothetical protein